MYLVTQLRQKHRAGRAIPVNWRSMQMVSLTRKTCRIAERKVDFSARIRNSRAIIAEALQFVPAVGRGDLRVRFGTPGAEMLDLLIEVIMLDLTTNLPRCLYMSLNSVLFSELRRHWIERRMQVVSQPQSLSRHWEYRQVSQ
jgi:hypothetical protein